MTAFIGEDRALRALQYTTLSELAEPVPNGVPRDGLVLEGSLPVTDVGRELGRHQTVTGDGFWVSDAAGKTNGYLTYQRLATVLGATITADETEAAELTAADEEHEEAAHALPH